MCQHDEGERAAERERVKALKEHDEEAYLRLVKDTKNQRIIDILKQTDAFMAELGARVEASRGVIGGDQPGASEDAMAVDDDTFGIKANNEKYNKLTHKVVEEITEQPRMMGQAGKMREYQMMGLRWLASLYNNGLNGILADEMGLGKTIQTVSLLAWLWEQKDNRGPFLCIVPLTTLHNNWKAEMQKWVPQLNIAVYEGKPDDRRRIREERIAGLNFNVLLTTFEYAMLDKRFLKKVLHSIGVYGFLVGSFAEPRTPMASIHDL